MKAIGEGFKFLKGSIKKHPTRDVNLEYLSKQDAVCVLVVDNSLENVFLVKQYRAGSDNDTLEAVAGLIDEGENPKEAAFREMLEETGYDTHTIESFYDITKKTAFYVSPGYSTEKLYFYIAKLKKDALAKEQKLDIGEDIEVVKMNINNALEDTDDLKTVYILEKLISLIKENSI